MKKIVYDDFSTLYCKNDDFYKKGKKEGIVVSYPIFRLLRENNFMSIKGTTAISRVNVKNS
ncbi:hypothetical protein ES705_45151 [subsurface metagenome]